MTKVKNQCQNCQNHKEGIPKPVFGKSSFLAIGKLNAISQTATSFS
jgi:hypothetical protein